MKTEYLGSGKAENPKFISKTKPTDICASIDTSMWNLVYRFVKLVEITEDLKSIPYLTKGEIDFIYRKT